MSRFDWLSEFLARLEDEHVVVRRGDASTLAPAHRLVLDPEDWGMAGRVAAGLGCRWGGVWGDPREADVVVRACLEHAGDYLVLQTEVPLGQALLASHTRYFPGANRLERHLHDLCGVVLRDHPDQRRWTRHQAWPDGEFPLRVDYQATGRSPGRTRADAEYPFAPVQGSGVYEIPVGPVHAGIIEPGHFRFQAVGEEVLRLEERLGYVHKGVEKLAVGREPAGLARLAGRVSGDSTVAHTWAAGRQAQPQLSRVAHTTFKADKLLWKHTVAPGLIDPRAIAAWDGKVAFLVESARLRAATGGRDLWPEKVVGQRLVCLDAATGNVLWENKDTGLGKTGTPVQVHFRARVLSGACRLDRRRSPASDGHLRERHLLLRPEERCQALGNRQ